MKRSFLLVACAASLAVWPARAEGAPKIKFDRLVYDFGVTSLVESVTGTFIFENVGDGELKIQAPKPSCGCTVAQLKRDTLQPGEQGELTFVLTLGAAAQQQQKVIHVPTNDPDNPVVVLSILAEAKTVVVAQPASVSIGELQLGGSTNVSVLLHRLDGRPLKIAEVDSSSELVTPIIEPFDETKPTTARINIEVAAAGMPRYLTAQLRVRTEDSIGAAVVISVHGRLLGDLKLEPEVLAWGMPDPDMWTGMEEDIILSRTLIVTATKPGKLRITNLSSDIKGMKLTVEPIERNRKFLIEATLPRRLTEPVRGAIRFDTNLSSLPKVEVPVEVNVWKH